MGHIRHRSYHLASRAEIGRACARQGGGPIQGTLLSRVRRKNPRPKNVIASQAGLLARGSSRWPRTFPVPPGGTSGRIGAPLSAYSCGGSAGLHPRGTSPASRLSLAKVRIASPCTRNLDRPYKAPIARIVNKDIKISIYLDLWGRSGPKVKRVCAGRSVPARPRRAGPRDCSSSRSGYAIRPLDPAEARSG